MNKMQKGILLVFATLFVFSIAFNAIAETKIGGPIAIDMTWTLDKSPYIVVQNIEVAEGATLTIEPGVMVKFDDYALIISGTLIARGTEEKMITFTSDQDSPEPGDWKGIKFEDSSVDAIFNENMNYVSGSILEYCKVEYGSGIKAESASIFVNHCTIKYNDGMGISITDKGVAVIANNAIQNNSDRGIAVNNLAEVNMTNNTISNNRGGIKIVNVQKVTIERSVIEANTAGRIDIHGGGIYLYGDDSLMTVANSSIINNTIYNEYTGWRGMGGGIYSSGGSLAVTNSTITHNTAYGWDGAQGGGIYSSGGSLTATNSTIAYNTADDNYDNDSAGGGGISCSGKSLVIENSTIVGNSAPGTGIEGGGIQSHCNTTTIINSIITNNTVEGTKAPKAQGGGVYIKGETATIKGNIFSKNMATAEGYYRGRGGGIYISSTSSTISNNKITDNSSEQGGGIYLYEATATIDGNFFGNNKAYERGGGIYLERGTATMDSNFFGSNVAPDKQGGGICSVGTPLSISYSVITQNTDGIKIGSTNVVISNCNFYGNENYAVINESSPDIDATNNWWGTVDPMEINQKIYDFFDDESLGKVLYNPFLLSPDTDAPVISPTGLTATSEGIAINLTWEPMNLDDLAGYKVYYDTDTEEPPYEGTEAAEGKSPIDVGKVTNYRISGSKPETRYYIAVTAYDTQGNEGWYGEVVTAETPAGELKPPLPPELSSPDDGVVIDTYTPILKWSASEGATSYSVQIAKDSKFSEILIEKPGIAGVQYFVPSDNLKNLETYYWRVKAANSAGTSDWSEVRAFRVISGPSFTLSLSPSLNFISLPMKPDVSYTARTFAEKMGATLVIRYDAPSQEFLPFVPEVSETGGFAIEGGQGYIVNVLEEKQVTFTGSLWTNTPPASIKQAPNKENPIWAFAVAGLVSTEPDLKENLSELRVTVKNQRTGQFSQCALTDDMREFAIAFVDMNRKSVVKVGDMLEITVRNSRGQLVSVPVVREVSKIDLDKATVVANIRLGEVIPSQSQLFQNYPNPFNPETWIPFQLAKSAEVTIRIYNVAGQLVRVINLGQKTAGRYLDKKRAAYWDGRNAHDEKISSGVYFYSINAGNFRATRRLVVAK